ncbi:MAG TPA: hypothetical protein VHM31_23090 [Polyangia bacterium]|nr:hypothetical protein [Polyangia bacterium]
MKLIPCLALAVAATAGFVAAVFTGGGCASDCGNNCQDATVWVGSANNKELNGILLGFDVNGPACPPASALGCLGDRETTSCTHVLIAAQQPGACDVLFIFSDRPNEILRLQFGPTVNANGSCCKGYPPLGPSVYTIPAKPTGPIYSGSADAGTYSTDAVVVLTDAGAGTDASRDAGRDAAHDAGADGPGEAGAP